MVFSQWSKRFAVVKENTDKVIRIVLFIYFLALVRLRRVFNCDFLGLVWT